MKKLIGFLNIPLLAVSLAFAQGDGAAASGNAYSVGSWKDSAPAKSKSAPASASVVVEKPAVQEAPAAQETPAVEEKTAEKTETKPAEKPVAKKTAKPAEKRAAKTAPAPAATPEPAPVAEPASSAQTEPASSSGQATPASSSAQAVPAEAPAPAATPAPAPVVTPVPVATADSVPAKTETAYDSAKKAALTTPENVRELRGKKSFAEYQQKQQVKRDSVWAVSSYHGFSFTGGRTYDKRLGEYADADDFIWATNLGLYYFYRYNFNPYISFQGRLGALYRYGRFEKSAGYGSAQYHGESYDLENIKSTRYFNMSVDAPMSIRFGTLVLPSSFVYMSLTLGVTKSVYDYIDVQNRVVFANPSAELKETLKYVDDYPYKKSHHTDGAFYLDDWESNCWFGIGADFRYVALEFQALIAANSTRDNHRYHDMFHKAMPTWRFMIDFGAY